MALQGCASRRWLCFCPLAFLALGAIFSGVFYHHEFVGDHAHEFWGDAISLAHDPLLEAPRKNSFLGLRYLRLSQER